MTVDWRYVFTRRGEVLKLFIRYGEKLSEKYTKAIQVKIKCCEQNASEDMREETPEFLHVCLLKGLRAFDKIRHLNLPKCD